jgi:hypothetical protein
MEPLQSHMFAIGAMAAAAAIASVLIDAAPPAYRHEGLVSATFIRSVLHGIAFYANLFRIPVLFFAAGFLASVWWRRAGSSRFIHSTVRRVIVPLTLSYMLVYAWKMPSADTVAAGSLWFFSYAALTAGILVLLIRFGLLRDTLLDQAASVVGRRGGLILLSLPAAAWMASLTQHDVFQPPPVPFASAWLAFLGYGCYFYVGWAMAGRPERLESQTRRWRLGLLITFAVSGVLFAAHTRVQGGLGIGRWIYCLSYPVVGWRWVFGLAGLFQPRPASSGKAGIHLAAAAFAALLLLAPVSLVLRTTGVANYFSTVLAALTAGAAVYALLVRNWIRLPVPACPADSLCGAESDRPAERESSAI